MLPSVIGLWHMVGVVFSDTPVVVLVGLRWLLEHSTRPLVRQTILGYTQKYGQVD
jgi:hypothetical protein